MQERSINEERKEKKNEKEKRKGQNASTAREQTTHIWGRRTDISLDTIDISESALDVKGFARDANVIPNWIAQFKQEVSLTGRTFEQLSIGRDEQDIVTFELKSKRGAEK